MSNWRKSKEKWYIDNKFMGRSVAYRPIKESDTVFAGVDVRKCADCGRDSTIIIHELAYEDKNKYQPVIWGYCGGCEIGG